jgi:hypothetical protein
MAPPRPQQGQSEPTHDAYAGSTGGGGAEIELLAAHRAEAVGAEFVGEIRGHDGLGQGRVIGAAVRRQEVLRQPRDRGRDPEPALGRHRRQEHLAQASPAGGIGGGDEFELRTAR